MKTASKTLFRNATPIVASCELILKSTGMGFQQAYNAYTNTYSPNHSNYPVVIQPVLHVSSPDGTVSNSTMYSSSSYTWECNLNQQGWKNINEYFTLGTDYIIDTSTSVNRGMLNFRKNLSTGDDLLVRVKYTFIHPFTNKTFTGVSNTELIYCRDVAIDTFQLCYDADPFINFNPLEMSRTKTLTFTVNTGGGTIADLSAMSGLSIGLVRLADGVDANGNHYYQSVNGETNSLITSYGISPTDKSKYVVTLDCGKDDAEHVYYLILKQKKIGATSDVNDPYYYVGDDGVGYGEIWNTGEIYAHMPITVKRDYPAIGIGNINNTPFVKGKNRWDKFRVVYKGLEVEEPWKYLEAYYCVDNVDSLSQVSLGEEEFTDGLTITPDDYGDVDHLEFHFEYSWLKVMTY